MRLWLILIALVLGAGPARAVLVQNGGFETPLAPAGSLTRYSTGQTIGPWTVVGASGSVDQITSTFTYEGYSFPAHGGGQWLDLTGVSNSRTGVAQTVKTAKGRNYTLTFWVGNVDAPSSGDLGTTSTVLVMVNGKQVLAAENSENGGTSIVWKMFSLTVHAKTAKTTIGFINGDPSNDTCDGIDDVSLTPLP